MGHSFYRLISECFLAFPQCIQCHDVGDNSAPSQLQRNTCGMIGYSQLISSAEEYNSLSERRLEDYRESDSVLYSHSALST